MSDRAKYLVAGLLTLVAWPLAQAQAPQETRKDAAPAGSTKATFPKKVVKSDAEWAKLLTRDQFLVTRRKATEPAFTGKLLHNKAKGVYACVGCDSPLFVSKTKFDSGTGWPSFYAPYTPGSVANEVDNSDGHTRVEVLCSTCDAHLGHVFDDGPAPTGLRYCMNSLALKFVKDTPPAAKSAARKDAPAKADASEPKAEAGSAKASPTGR